MKRVAIPVANNTLSKDFCTCSYCEVFEIDGKQVQSIIMELPVFSTIDLVPDWLEKQGINDLITHRVNKEIIGLFASKKVNLYVGIALRPTQELINDYLQGKLVSNKNIIQEITN